MRKSLKKRQPKDRMRLVPPLIRNEPPSSLPYLNSTAHWYLADAWDLFYEICGRCDVPTAKHIFQKCISVVDEQEIQAAAIDKARAAQRTRELNKLPTEEAIAAADRKTICNWWARLPGRKFSAKEKQSWPPCHGATSKWAAIPTTSIQPDFLRSRSVDQ